MKRKVRVPLDFGRFTGTIVLMISAATITAQVAPIAQSSLALMPLPSSITRGEGVLIVTPAGGAGSTFTYRYEQTHDPRLEAAVKRALLQLGRTCGGDVLRSAVDHPAPANASLIIGVTRQSEGVQTVDEDESYQLTVTSQGARLNAATDTGAMHGLETILQLATYERGACVLPAVTISDTPRFRWRGFMLDVSRHFEPVSVIERTLDGMAAAKLNVFHWHLSDDQGFRAESKRFPKLTGIASDGQFYTQDEMREVVAYAGARGIRVVPEFDMPGHGTSWILAYPELSPDAKITQLPIVYGTPTAVLDPTRESTYKFINTLVEEMGRIFPDACFHIGGDEVQGKAWLSNPHVVEFMKKKKLTTPAELQALFNQRLETILKKHGKKMIGWDEILNPALPKTIEIQSWRGEASLAEGARQGYQGTLSAPYYLDGQKSSAQMFLADPIPSNTALTPDQQKLILGGEVCMWAEQLNPETVDSRVWPRTMAVAERFWSPQSDRDVADMYRRLRINSLKLENVGLTHISGPEVLRRSLLLERDPAALEVLASVLEPVSFHERYQGQHTNGLTTLDRLVDAVVADPPSRQEIAGDVDALAGSITLPPPADPRAQVDLSGDVPSGVAPSTEVALARLRRRFLSWQAAEPQLLKDVHDTPRLSEAATRAEQLGELAQVGLSALDYLQTHTAPPAGWQAQQMIVLDAAEQPSGLVRFTCLHSIRKLVLAAAQSGGATTP
ncbi:MAG TPA: family 20 glycosylhydrolase [Acidobacteriaceae bacterium]|nr:family 20 glycosylhydrolase [Acidobacteriaceae bacterium]